MLERFLSLLYVKPLQVRMKIAAVATVVSDVIGIQSINHDLSTFTRKKL